LHLSLTQLDEQVPLVAGIWFCPESPKWLMKKGRYTAAFNSYIRLRKHPLQAARDMYYSHVLFVEEKAMAAGTTYWSRNVDCWKIPRLRRASLAACTVMIAQQMCGINSMYLWLAFSGMRRADRYEDFHSHQLLQFYRLCQRWSISRQCAIC
jgi:hypothetical protein